MHRGLPVKIEPFFDVSAPQVIHQILDCIFMGPYARVDYWPMPACQAGEECLTGPYWSRDTKQGQSRSVDPYNCLTVNSLPYTCGSPGRQSLIRYFVNTFLSNANANASVFQQSVLAQLREIKATWPSPSYTTYGCVCADKSQSHTCCAGATGQSPFFPPNLVLNTKELSPDKVLNSIDVHFDEVYARALQTQGAWLDYLSEVAPAEQAKYDWSGSRRASDEARLNPKRPAYTYGPEEAMSPLMSVESTLWDVCHASLKQVFWTLPIHSSNNTIVFGAQRAADGGIVSDPLSFDALPYDGDAGRLEDYIRALVSQAALKSPLFRHYQPRHAPSPSLVCAPDPSAPPPVLSEDGEAAYNDYVHDPSEPPSVTVLEGRRLGRFPVYDYRRMALGAVACPCDWALADGLCQAPPAACAAAQAVSARADCLFHPSNASSILAAFAEEWPCPEFELSAHWGLLDKAAAEQWLQGHTSLTVDAQDLLQYGRAGARAGGMDTLRASSKRAIHPAARHTPLERARLTSCGAGERLMGVRDLAQGFVEQLFPMAQGVEESGVAAHCLRYTMEVALLQALSLVSQESYEASSQIETVARWRRRCGAQLQLLSLCVNLDVFRAPDTDFNLLTEPCMHFAPVYTANLYVTPECLVFLDGLFYDPCRCLPCVGNGAPLNITHLRAVPACKLRFDPRSSVRAAPVGWWPADNPGASEANAHLSDPTVLLPEGFSRLLMDAPEAVGNTRPAGAPWWSTEGPMDESSQDCDMVADWWPDDWDYPVGYHVTVPCEAQDAAYRSFHQAFAYTRTDEVGVPVLTYQHDLLRDGELVDTNFGVNGLCRSLNWGMESFVTNTMRYCTRAPVDQLEDYSVYREAGHEPVRAWTEWACATSHTHLPWPDSTVSGAPNTDTFEPSLYSVGTVPNMPPAGANYYPHDSGADTYDPGPWREILSEQGWGRGCSDYPLVFCATDADCPSGAYSYRCRGRLCKGTLQRCGGHQDCNTTASGICEGVCIERSVGCLSHAECSDGKMCTGLGACVTPVITMQNKISTKDYAFHVSSRGGTCPARSRNFSMLAGSHWAYVDNDVLRLHGLCSYGDWFKYQQTLSNPKCKARDMGDHWQIDPVTCPYIDLDALVPNVTHWWEFSAVRPQVMYMHPSNCDRDYERLQDSLGAQFVSCAPTAASLRISQQDISDKLAFDQFARMHLGDTPAAGNVRIPLAKMKFSNDKRYGFLGIGAIANDKEIENMFQSCSNLDQCSVPPFTVRGKPAVRKMFVGDSWVSRNYTHDDVYKCGVTGYADGDRCRLDLSVLQMYRFLCVEEFSVHRRCRPLVPDLDILCGAVTTTYQAGYSTVASNVDALNSILYAIPVPTDQDTYLDTTDCMQDLYSYMTDGRQLYTQLYWVFDFVLYEVSFDWFYQCIVMNRQAVDTSATTARRNQDCQAYRYASSYSIDGYTPRSSRGDDPMTMLRFVRGGYARADVNRYEARNLNVSRAKLETIKASLVETIYGGSDTSYSRCSRNLKWKVGPEYRGEYRQELRSLIHTLYYAGGCEGTWLTDQVKFLRSMGYTFTVNDWRDYVTTADADSFFKDQGWGAAPTLLETIFEWALRNMKVRLADRVMGFNPAIEGLRFPTRTQAFVMDNYMQQFYTETLLMQLDPTYTMHDNGIFVGLENEDVHHVCLFDNLQHDPLLRVRDTSACREQKVNRSAGTLKDDLIVCPGDVTCSRCPVYYMTDGVFNCQYFPTLPGYPCNASAPGCGTSLFNALYNKFYTAYVADPVEPLSPTMLPWFAPEQAWGFSFDLTQALDFLGNIMPNKEQSVMCTIKPEIVNLMECTNEHYLTLKSHVQKYYMRNGSVVVPSDAQLDWDVDSAFLASGAIFSFASTDRDISRTFLKGLFDDKTVCKGESTSDARVCWKASNATRYNSMNPWGLGYWNPYVECDVDFTGQTQMPVEFVNARCESVTCPEGSPYYENMPLQSTCSRLFGQRVTTPGVPQIDVLGKFIPYNLCHHRLVEDEEGCLHDQALLGGFDGLPVASGEGSLSMTADTPYASLQYKVSPNMYTPSTWEIPDDFMGGLFDQTNPLWAGRDSPYGFLRVPPEEIGIHRIGFQLTPIENSTIAQLNVYKLPLGTDGDALDLDAPNMASLPVREWVPNLLAQIAADSAVNQQRAGDYNSLRTNSSSASCPLRRFAFYGSPRPAFAPTMPSPQRAYHLFGAITGRAYAHPTMGQLTTGEFFGKYSTVNGFCFCPLVDGTPQTHCQVPIDASEHDSGCSLTQTVETLMGAVGTSHVFRPLTSLKQDTSCRMALDWPRVPIPLRDGSPGPSADEEFKLASDQEKQRCHVLDRFQPFQYRYQSVPEFPSHGPAGGVRGACQTRRVAQITPAVLDALGGRRCVRDSLGADEALVRCAGRIGQISVPRLAKLTPPETVAKARNRRRTRCNQCAAPPRFETNGGSPMAPESSFGRPFRLSAERMMAKDLREAVCGADQACPLLNRTAWRAGEFMRNFLLRPQNLFVSVATPSRQATPPRGPVDDSANWTNHGWVYCPTRKALVSGQGCLGSIPRDVWRSSKTSVCPRLVRALSSNGSRGGMTTVPFFQIDNYTQAVDKAYVEAQRLVGLANCIAAGNFSCLPKPWVYHPASFVPSNLEWAYQTVLEYYRLVNASACPMSPDELKLVEFNQKFMQDCPANTMRFFQDILAIVRLVATELAYIVSTLFSMAFKLVTLLFAGAETGIKNSVRVAQQELAADWLWLKNQARGMLAGVNRLLLDMLFSTGQIGKVLLNFLTTLCEKVNGIYKWLLTIWCSFLQKHLPRFLTVMRSAISMIAAGFEILQDFMDVVFQGVLPAAFMQKYGTALFQDALLEKYSQPTNRKQKYLTRVQSSARVFTSTTDKVKAALKKTANAASGVPGKVGMGLAAGLLAWQAVEDIMGAINYPKNFTLFDFSGVFGGIDDMMDRIPDDEICLEYSTAQRYNMSFQLFSCFKNSLLDDPALANRAATSIAPTLCWANAQTSLGQSNLFSCHSGSTCCPDNECATPIVCNECPTPRFAGEARYGCNTLRQQCQCAVPLDAYTPCTSNQQCGGTSQCILASLASTVSYGTIPCAQCITQSVYCSIPSTGYPGQCTCYTDTALPLALCTDASGTSTRVDGNRLCAFSADSSASDSTWQFPLEQLAMVQCARAPTAICSTVWATQSTSVRLAVAIPPLRASGRGRRLLWDDSEDGGDAYAYDGDFEPFGEADAQKILSAPGWDQTGAPCAELVRTHQQGGSLGVLERHELHRCAYWRFAGRRTIRALNLTGLEAHETFLLSAEDLAKALTDREALLEVITAPWVFVYAGMYHPWARPLRAAATVLANSIEQTDWLRKWLLAAEEEAPEELLEFVTGSDGMDVSEAVDDLLNFSQWQVDFRSRRLIDPRPPVTRASILQGKTPLPSPASPASPRRPRRPRRALLSVISDIRLVQAFSAKVAQSGDPTVPVPQQVAQVWGQGPFVWPPRFDYQNVACPIGTVFLELTTEAVSVVVLYYVNFDTPLPPIDRSFRATLPQISWNRTQAALAIVAETGRRPDTWASSVFHYVTGQILGLSRSDISNFFVGSSRWSLLWTVQSLFQCDLAAAVSCSRHKRDLLMSIVLFVLLYLAVQMVAGATGFTFLTTALFYSAPLILLWYVYGVAPSCFPILPPCLLADLIAAAEYAMPASVSLPPELMCGNQTLANATCLRQCAELGFGSWADTLAFSLCDTDARWCEALGHAGENTSEYLNTVAPLFAPLQSALLDKSQWFLAGNGTAPSRLAAYRVCAWVTWVSVLPFLLLLASLVFAAGSILLGVVQLGPSFFSLLAQTWAFHRAPAEIGRQ